MTRQILTYSHVAGLCIYRAGGAYIVAVKTPSGRLLPLQDATFWTYEAALLRYRAEQKAIQA